MASCSKKTCCAAFPESRPHHSFEVPAGSLVYHRSCLPWLWLLLLLLLLMLLLLSLDFSLPVDDAC